LNVSLQFSVKKNLNIVWNIKANILLLHRELGLIFLIYFYYSKEEGVILKYDQIFG